MTEEQILAMAAKRNPAIVEALKERYRNTNAAELSERERQLYDRLMSQQESQQERVERAFRDAQLGQQTMKNKALYAMASIQKDRPSVQQPVFITPGAPVGAQPVGGTVQADTGSAGQKLVACAGC